MLIIQLVELGAAGPFQPPHFPQFASGPYNTACNMYQIAKAVPVKPEMRVESANH